MSTVIPSQLRRYAANAGLELVRSARHGEIWANPINGRKTMLARSANYKAHSRALINCLKSIDRAAQG